MLLHRRIAPLALLVLLGCQDITVREAPELEGDDVGECDDGADNDADGLFDCADDDCDGAPACGCDDSDGDGVCDGDDACPGADDALDTDGDGVPDCLDPCPQDDPDDSDGDGVCDGDDACPGADDALDTDGDGVPDCLDPCPQDDPDDSDGDGVCDGDDLCPGGDDGADADGDGVADACDPCPDDAPDDSDGDGVCDGDDLCPGGDDNIDTDGDGTPDFCEPVVAPGQLLVSDGFTGRVYSLDLSGNVLGSWLTGVGQLRGVAHDRRNGDGFWVLDNAAPTSLRKLDWSGALQTTLTSAYAAGVDVRGLDYWLDPGGNDRLAYVARNPNSIDVSYHVLVATGAAQVESSFYNGGFQAGYWGMTDLLDVGSLFERRAARGALIEEFAGPNQSGPAVTVPGGVSLRGIAAVDATTSYVVDNAGQQILLVNHDTGAVLSSFLAPGPDPLGISYAP